MVTTLLASVILLLVFFVLRSRNPSQRKPPGPRGISLLKSTTLNSKLFSEWTDRWGDIVSITLFGQTIVVLGSTKVASDLLDKRSLIYSDRPSAPFCTELIGWKNIVLFASYGDRLREQRRLVHNLVSDRGKMDQILSTTQLEHHWHMFLYKLLASPENFAEHIHNTVVGVLLQLSYGAFDESRQLINQTAKAAMEQFSVVTAPGASMVDVFPFLQHLPKWFPGASFHQRAQIYSKVLHDMVNIPFDIVKSRLMEGTASPGFVSGLLQGALSADKEHLIKWTAASMYFGGSNTTVPTILTFFLAMALHPDVQLRAQAEIDSVTNGLRLPSLHDRSSLPYVDAVLKEVLRWNAPASLGLRRTTKDDTYDNFFIPKGSIVIANIRGFLEDPREYADPKKFNPDRFMMDEHGFSEKDPRPACSGNGRRICPGFALADSEMFIAYSLILAVFDISRKSQLSSDANYFVLDGLVSWPLPFECNIKPRSSHAEKLVASVVDAL